MAIDLTKLDTMSSDAISLLLDSIDKERQTASTLLDTVQTEKLELEKSLAIIRIAIQKAKTNLRDLSNAKEITERAFWRAKGR